MDPPRIEETTLRIAAEARRDWRYATDVIARAFRQARELSSHDRRLVAERVYGLLRMHRRIDATLAHVLRPRGRALDELRPADLDLLRYIAYRVTIEAAPAEAAAVQLERFGLEPAALTRASDMVSAADPGVALSFPDWLVRRVFAELGEADGRNLLASLNERAPLSIRANTLKVERNELAQRLAADGIACEPSPYAPHGLRLVTRVNVFGLAAFREGWLEVQDEASQLVADVVAPPPRGAVIDACAGAGGKTLAIGAALAGKGRLLALDVDPRKLTELRRRARRAGLANVQAMDVRQGPPAATAARVLVDAPCSGLGVLRRNPEARWRLSAEEVDAFPARQLALLETYAPLVEAGGRLVYATCTFLRAENEAVIERFLGRHDAFRLFPVKEIWGSARSGEVGDGTFLRTWPHRHGTDGFFCAVLRRS